MITRSINLTILRVNVLKIIKPILAKYDGMYFMESPLVIEDDNGFCVEVCDINLDGTSLATDLTSCPTYFDRWLNDLNTIIPYCSIVHDSLLVDFTKTKVSVPNKPTWTAETIKANRSHADYMYYKTLRVVGVPLWKCIVLYLAVRGYSLTVVKLEKLRGKK